MAGENTNDANGASRNSDAPRALKRQAILQENLLIIERALKRDQERHAEFARDQAREYIDSRDKRRTQIEEMILAEAASLKNEGMPDSDLVASITEKFFAQTSPKEVFPVIADELRQEREAIPLESELRFFAENASDPTGELTSEEVEYIVRVETQFREHNDQSPLSDTIKEMWGDPETRSKILKYGSYGVMAAVLVGSGGAAAPGMMASQLATRMMPHIGKAVDRVSDVTGRALVRHGVISPETYSTATEKMLALGNQVKTSRFFMTGKMAAACGLAVLAGAAGADAAGLFQTPSPDAIEHALPIDGAVDSEFIGESHESTYGAAENSIPQEAGTNAPLNSQVDDLHSVSGTDAIAGDLDSKGAPLADSQADAGTKDAVGGGGKATNVLANEGLEGDWARNVLDGSAETAQAPDSTGAGSSAISIPADNLIQSMKEAGLSSTQVEMFYAGGELSDKELADIVELSDNPVGMMQVLASQGVDVASLEIEMPKSGEGPFATQHATHDLAVDPPTLPPIEVTVENADTLSEIIAEKMHQQGLEVTPSLLYGDGATPGLVEQIASHNPHITDPDMIYPGDTITLPQEVLHGSTMVEPTLKAESIVSAEAVAGSPEATAPQNTSAPDISGGHVDPSVVATATEVTPEATPSGLDASGSIVHDLASGQLDVVDQVNAHLEGYQDLGSQTATDTLADTQNAKSPSLEGGVAQVIASGKFDVVDHLNENLGGKDAAMASHQEISGHETTGGWRDRLAGAMGKAKAYMMSFTSTAEHAMDIATEDSQGAGATSLEADKSSWEVLTEAGEQAKREWEGQGSPMESVEVEETNKERSTPTQQAGSSDRMYASHSRSQGPGM